MYEEFGAAYTLLDYGIALVALVILGVSYYFFIRFLNQRAGLVNSVLEELVRVCKSLQQNHYELRTAVLRLDDEIRNTQEKLDEFIKKEGGVTHGTG